MFSRIHGQLNLSQRLERNIPKIRVELDACTLHPGAVAALLIEASALG